MLVSLDIRDMLIIDQLTLDFADGLNVLTGETGTGKSILLDALGIVLGWRGRADLVRAGCDQGEVSAVFAIAGNRAAMRVLDAAGLTADNELIIRRVSTKDGRKTAWINDRRVSAQVLRQLSKFLVERHGQQDDRGVLDPGGHIVILDDYAGLEADVAAIGARWRQVAAARKALNDVTVKLSAMRDEEEYLRHAVAEISDLAPQPGEDATLAERRQLIKSAAKIRADIEKASASIGHDGAEAKMLDGVRWLENLAPDAAHHVAAPLATLLKSLNELALAQQGIADTLQELSFDAQELDRVEERLFAIRGLARKYDVQPDGLADLAQSLQDKVAAFDGGDAEVAKLTKQVAVLYAAYQSAAIALTSRRQKAAKALDKAMAAELAPLKLERAQFKTDVSQAPEGATGQDKVLFQVATSPGTPVGPLNKIASGGELSRFLLALKVCLTKKADGLSLIFDEIDRGVGGATADAVGRRLAHLSENTQILVVTHSPQVAARAHKHWRVEKTTSDAVTLSNVTHLDRDARIDEIARMLAGDKITDQARAAAKVLIKG